MHRQRTNWKTISPSDKMKRGLVILTFLFSLAMGVGAQNSEIHAPRIATLQVVAGNDWLSPPVVELNGSVPINISFDDLTHEYHRYVYTLEHCEADWTTSEALFESDYIEGFYEGNTIDDYEESANTNVLYTHYRLQLPNGRMSIKMSGNYKLHVFDENNDNEPILTACFMVVEQRMNIGLAMTTNTDADIRGRHQQIEMEVAYGDVDVTRPDDQLHTVVMQNGHWFDAAYNAQPQFTMAQGLKWSHCRDFIFNGGNEYRRFETLDVDHTTLGLEAMRWDGNDYHAFVWTDDPRPNYVYEQDANGAFYIRNSNNCENDTMTEYLFVHFRMKAPRMNGDIYLNGTWTHDQFLPRYRMEYNEQEQQYEAVVPLKQGYYSYQYLLLTDEGSIEPVPTEGNFYQTENRYQALIYFKGPADRTDRLVGYRQLISK